MKTIVNKLTIQFTAFVLLLAVATFIFQNLLPAMKISVNWPGILLFMYIVSLGILFLLTNATKSKMTKFVNTYLLVSFSKMILFVGVIFVYAWLQPEDAVSFILTFLVYYFFLLIYEVVVLLKIKKTN